MKTPLPPPNEAARYPTLRGRHVLITGGASGIGEALVWGFSRQGCKVSFADIAEVEGHALERRIRSELAADIRFEKCDITDCEALQSMIQCAVDVHGPVDVLINNAANDQRHSLLEIGPLDWDRYVAVNLRHYLFSSQAVLPGMMQAGRGVILNMGSISWIVKVPDMPVYTACKAAVHGLTGPMARQFGAHGIRVNTILPGAVQTPRQQKLWESPEVLRLYDESQCIKDRIQSEDICAMALFLASDDARMCTGQNFVVDAGWI